MLAPRARLIARPLLPLVFVLALLAAFIGGISVAPKARAAGTGYWHTSGRQILDSNGKVAWSFGGNQSITNAWNATVTQSGTTVTATNASFNGALGPSTSTTFGLQGTYSGSDPAPTLTCAAS